MQIIGMIIGVVPQFRKLLVGDSAPLHVVQDSVVVLGWASSTTQFEFEYQIKMYNYSFFFCNYDISTKYPLTLIDFTLFFSFIPGFQGSKHSSNDLTSWGKPS